MNDVAAAKLLHFSSSDFCEQVFSTLNIYKNGKQSKINAEYYFSLAIIFT